MNKGATMRFAVLSFALLAAYSAHAAEHATVTDPTTQPRGRNRPAPITKKRPPSRPKKKPTRK